MNFKALRFLSFQEGNYGSGSYSVEDWLLGAVLFRSPVVLTTDESGGEENWTRVAKAVWGIATPDKLLLALFTREEGKGGRGCDPYKEERWQFIDTATIPGLSAEALRGLAPKRQE